MSYDKPWQDWTGDQLRVNGLDRGPEFLPILHLALDLFFQIRSIGLKQKICSIPKTYIMVQEELKFDKPFADVEQALILLSQGNYIHYVVVKGNPLTALTDAAERALSYHKDFGTRNTLMFYLVTGARIG